MWKTILLCFQAEFSNLLCKEAITCSLVGSQVGCQMTLIQAFFSTKFYYGGCLSLKKGKKSFKKCYVFCPISNISSCFRPGRNENFQGGGAGGEKDRLVFQSSLHPCSHCEVPKDEIPPCKMSRDQIFGCDTSKGVAYVGEPICTF